MFARKLRIIHLKFKIQVLEHKRCVTSEVQSNSQILTECLGLSNNIAKVYIANNRLSRINPEVVMKTVAYCKELGFNNSDILKNAILLRAPAIMLDRYQLVMKEGGFSTITPYALAKFRTLCRKPVAILKEKNFIKKDTNVGESFIKYLNPCPGDFYVQNDDYDTWSDIHQRILYKYLKWRLQFTTEEIDKLIETHPGMIRKSFTYLCENIAIAEELGFTNEKMLKYGYILHNYPKYTKEVLEKFPVLAGVCMKRAMRMYPKLIMVSPSNIEKIYKIIKEHDIPDEAIQKRMNVFHLSPETVEFRLNELKKIADLKVLWHNPNILKLVVHHNRAQSRLSFLKQIQIKCTGVAVLGNDDNKFNIHIREGRDTNTSIDIFSFLRGLFKQDIDQFKDNFKRHPYFLQVPLVAMEDTFYFLKSKGYTPSAILNVLYILLYPKEKIIAVMEEVSLFEKQREKPLNQINRLNLTVYFIEKDHHFSGDGIWLKNDVSEESSYIFNHTEQKKRLKN